MFVLVHQLPRQQDALHGILPLVAMAVAQDGVWVYGQVSACSTD
jgi:hypothetical protein